MSNSHNNTIASVRRMDDKLDKTNGEIEDFMRAQAGGEEPDPSAFMAMMEKRMTVQQAMQAQAKLNEKPFKTVLGDVR
ncbi:MAG: hypothetical protein V4754_18915 [Pseudomonadota bacterium]